MAPALRMTRSIKEKLPIFLRFFAHSETGHRPSRYLEAVYLVVPVFAKLFRESSVIGQMAWRAATQSVQAHSSCLLESHGFVFKAAACSNEKLCNCLFI